METENNSEQSSQNIVETDQVENNSQNSLWFFSTHWKYNVVTNPEAIELYSRKSIYFFTCFFSVFFGGVLMIINLKKLNNRAGQRDVLIYTILTGISSITLLSLIPRNTVLTLMVSMLGSFALYNIYWKKYIGENTKYRTKAIWQPLIIGLVIMMIILIPILLTQ